MFKPFIVAIAALSLLLASCLNEGGKDLPSGTIDGMTIDNDPAGERVTAKNDTIRLDTVPGAPKRAATKTLTLTLVAEISPPVIGGKTLQASSVALEADFAYVSYNYRGDTALGGVDVIQIKSGKNATLRSQVLFDDADVSSLHYDGYLYLATGTSDAAFASSAVLERIRVDGGKLVLQARERVALNSFAATAVTVSGTQVFATSGNTGGLHVLSQSSLAGSSIQTLGDARWVDYDDTRVVVAQGTPGRIAVYAKSSMALANTWTFTGADVPEAKTTVRVIGGKALIAAGTGGVKLMNLATGKIVGSIPVPVVTGVSAALSVANAADADGDLVYVSNGEAGVYAVGASSDLSGTTGDADIALTVLGKLKFNNLQSVNHVAFDGNTLVVAAGKGGVKIISVKWQ
ncbi:MAG: hypothetical protein K0Q91_893 [Fibrobacteria bacterium]|jgi:hypothetical protein|nr:hypothetical protein [Fibrobacteria bacterium]